MILINYKPLQEFTDKSHLSLFINDLEHLIQSTKTNFDIIAVSESRIIKNTSHQLI